mmetsp:Transcript_46058/g.71904  ORF Transcript_46058/g.71904 Transcript_46058/m.71904 type:complete len:788 (-) Transcript_46058:109-2472(-)
MSGGIKVQKNTAHSNGSMPKVVGPNVQGKREEYQLVRRLQSALFGGVYEAKGLSSGRDFAIKVLHKSELTKAQESNSIEFCEVPLSEIKFAEHMRGHPHVMEAEEHFEDAYCFYVVFELARGGDLLEALKQKPHGFDEAHAQFLIKQAVQGMALLHERRVAMQDVSLENMLLHVQETTGHYQVKICDPGQAVIFDVDENGEELPVKFRGLVGKSFRPPELHEQQSYIATKVDSWCLGWSTFYLLTAQPLFMSADPAQQDADWLLFQQGDFASLFQQKVNLCSPVGLDFIFRLLQIEPKRRMSIVDALSHSWLADPSIAPVLAPKEFWPDSLRGDLDRRPAEVVDVYDDPGSTVGTQNMSMATEGPNQGQLSPGQLSPATLAGTIYANELPTWSSANTTSGGMYKAGGSLYGGLSYGVQSQSNMPAFGARVLSPPRSPRSPRSSGPQRLPFDRFGMDDRSRPRYAGGARLAHVISTTHSPAPSLSRGHGSQMRSGSPLQRQFSPSQMGELGSSTGYSNNVPTPTLSGVPGYTQLDSSRPPMLTPRSGSARSPTSPPGSAVPPISSQATEVEERVRGRAAWAFRNEGKTLRETVSPDASGRQRGTSPFGLSSHVGAIVRPNAGGSGSWQVQQTPYNPSRTSPQRGAQNAGQGSSITFPRSISPGEVRALSPGTANLRTLSPGVSASRLDGIGFSWNAVPPVSPRNGAGPGLGVSRIASPSGLGQVGGVSRIASPGSGLKQATFTQGSGFAWSPEPPSPRTSPRSYSPGPVMAAKTLSSASSLPRWPMPM